jgi:hypothetical protein
MLEIGVLYFRSSGKLVVSIAEDDITKVVGRIYIKVTVSKLSFQPNLLLLVEQVWQS